MSLRLKYLLYLVALHLTGGVLAWFALGERPLLLLPIELGVAASFAVGAWLVGRLFQPLALVRAGAEYIAEQEFTVRFRESGEAEVDRLIGVYNQMVDHLREERTRLREQNYFLDRVLEASPSGVLTLDHDGRATMVNPAAARLLGAPATDLRGARLGELGVPLAAALDTLEPGESRVVSLRGGTKVKCQRSAFVDRGFAREFFMLEEVTEELRQSERAAYDKLIRTLSHEVNNSAGAVSSLLQSCLTYADQLAPEDRADFEQALRVASDRTTQLAAFMAGFAGVVRLPPPKRQMVDIRELLESVERLMRSECERRRIRWVWAPSGRLPLIPMDRAQMEQVFVNVVKNAAEAIDTEGTITVRMGEHDGAYFVAVEDTGPGIPPEVEDNLFTPFFSTKAVGQGIGLTMSREILAAHGFEASLTGPAGEPTRFTVRF